MTNYLYYPGCSLHTNGKPYDESLREVFKALDVPLEEVNDWNCCGATSYMAIDETKAFALAARNLAIAEKQQGERNGTKPQVIAPCSGCYLVLLKTKNYLHDYPEVNRKICGALESAGLQYTGNVDIRHPLDVLVNDIGLKRIGERVTRKLKGLNVASYYGCQIVRPFKAFDDPFYPVTLDNLVKALGAEAIDWPMKTRCCGGTLMGTIPEAGLRLNKRMLDDAQKRGADMMITCCPLCQFNLECYQGKMLNIFDDHVDLPVLFFTQLMGMAFGIPEKKLGIQRLFKRPHFEHARGGTEVHV